jgi:uncharacterized protein YjbI with pentapeptide repeats
MLITVAIAALLAAAAGALLALWIQPFIQRKPEEQRQEWERAQENYLQSWASQQEKRAAELEARLTTQFQQLQQAWKQWVTQDTIQATALSQEYKAAIAQLKVDHELLRVMRVEEIPLTTNSNGQQQPAFSNWRPVMLQGADLSRRDLSHRYLGHANLREARLSGATLFMANLSGANLAKANLAFADLSGVDLSGADLRDAILTDTNLLVADLNKANLTGANLLGAKGLTPQQIHPAIYDSTTLFDADFDLTPTSHRITNAGKSTAADTTLSHIEPIHPVQSSSTATPAPVEAPSPKLETPAPEIEAAADTSTPTPKQEPQVLAVASTPAASTESEGTPAPIVDEAAPITSSRPEETPTVEAAPVTSPEPEELPKESELSAEPAPAEPEPEAPAAPSEPMAAAAAPEISDATPEVVVTPSEAMESSEPPDLSVPHAGRGANPQLYRMESSEPPDLSVPQAAADIPSEGPREPIPAALDNLSPEGPAPAASPETSETEDAPYAQEDMLPLSFLPDMTSFIQHLDETAAVSPLPSNDSLLDPAVADLLADTQENRHTGEFNTATPNRKNSGKRAAKED